MKSMVHHHAVLYNWQLCSLVIIVFGSINTSHFCSRMTPFDVSVPIWLDLGTCFDLLYLGLLLLDVQLRNEELRIGAYRSGGSGGQHANTTNSAVRITHLPTRKNCFRTRWTIPASGKGLSSITLSASECLGSLVATGLSFHLFEIIFSYDCRHISLV